MPPNLSTNTRKAHLLVYAALLVAFAAVVVLQLVSDHRTGSIATAIEDELKR